MLSAYQESQSAALPSTQQSKKIIAGGVVVETPNSPEVYDYSKQEFDRRQMYLYAKNEPLLNKPMDLLIASLSLALSLAFLRSSFTDEQGVNLGKILLTIVLQPLFTVCSYVAIRTTMSKSAGFFASRNLNHINSLSDIYLDLIRHYNYQYDLTKLDHLMTFEQKKFAELGMSLESHDFLEHVLLYRARCLPLSPQIKTCLHLQHESDTGGVFNPRYSIVAFYGGVSDKTIESESSALFFKFEKNINKIDPDYARRDREFHFYPRKYFNQKYLLKLDSVAKDFITNPIFIAQYLIKNENKIPNKKFIVSTCAWLIGEIELFKELRNGISNPRLCALQTQLTEIIKKYPSIKILPEKDRKEEFRATVPCS